MVAENKLPVLDMLSDAMRDVVRISAELAPEAYDTSAGFEAMRAAYVLERRYWNEGGPAMSSTRDTEIATPDGQVTVRFHTPQGAPPKSPAIVYIHGGGFVLGGLDTHDKIMRVLADETKSIVVGVDYSLSPEAKFPTAVVQCVSVAQHLHKNGAHYGIDGDKLGFAGDSGGAMLCLGSYLYLRDEMGEGTGYVKALLLYYGMFGLRDSISRRLLGGPWDGCAQEDLDYYMQCYLASPEDAYSPYVDCLSADLRQMPPAFIVAAELDPLRDDSTALASILDRHDSPNRLVVFPGVLHAFLHNSRHLPEAMDALRQGAAFFREAVSATPPEPKPTTTN
ncbi:MAG: acetyl esterase [Propionibacteriaceae bacterium]|nr:acetyl esterase [Propionibacteriaceae bacterium]